MSDWDALDREIWYWAEAGRTATLWWRDDDATWPSPEVRRLLSLGASAEVPVALAVVPRDAGPDLRDHLLRHPLASVLVHGFGHVNHAPDGEPQDEYGPHRPRDVRLRELAESRRRLEDFPGFVPVLVPPWNREPADLLDGLTKAGFAGVSSWGADAGPRRINVHADVMDWETGRFAGNGRVLGQLVGHLTARRTGLCPDGPTGLMTHHAYHDEGVWAFLGELLERTRPRPGIAWLTATEALEG